MGKAGRVHYLKAVNAENAAYTGRGVTIAMLDTGVCPVADLTKPVNRVAAFKDFVNGLREPYDDNAHGTHVAGVAAGNGRMSDGKYRGLAPEARIAAVKILDKNGKGGSASVLAGIRWVVENRAAYNIRVLNLSIGAADEGSSDPLVKAAEAAWDAGIAVVIAAGNNGPAANSVTSPGISRKVITVGACDENASFAKRPLSVSPIYFSGRGPTSECVVKPDIVAPGADIVSCRALFGGARQITPLKNNEHYAEMSGTSMATPIVSGAIALLLEKRPALTPDEVKLALKMSAVSLNYPRNRQGWGLLDVGRLLET